MTIVTALACKMCFWRCMSGNNEGLARDLIAVLIFTSTQVLSAHSARFALRLVPVFNLNATPLPESH